MRLAIVTSHPIQYLAPWFELLAGHGGLDLKVFYLWNREETSQHDHGFGQAVIWDLPLLRGYAHEFVPNVATQPGTEHFSGLNNPDLTARVDAFQPQAVFAFWIQLPVLLSVPPLVATS